MARLRKLVPDAEKELAEAQLEGAQELANRIRARARRRTGRYAASIQADRLSARRDAVITGNGSRTKDPNATGIFADFRWRFLEYGTDPHNAQKKGGTKAGQLAFRTGRRDKLGRAPIYHPGARAFPHIFPTYRAYRKKLRRRMATAVNRAVRKAKRK